MARLGYRQRQRLPASAFALPSRRFPVEDRAHARDALARATQAYGRGSINAAQLHQVDQRAREELQRNPDILSLLFEVGLFVAGAAVVYQGFVNRVGPLAEPFEKLLGGGGSGSGMNQPAAPGSAPAQGPASDGEAFSVTGGSATQNGNSTWTVVVQAEHMGPAGSFQISADLRESGLLFFAQAGPWTNIGWWPIQVDQDSNTFSPYTFTSPPISAPNLAGGSGHGVDCRVSIVDMTGNPAYGPTATDVQIPATISLLSGTTLGFLG